MKNWNLKYAFEILCITTVFSSLGLPFNIERIAVKIKNTFPMKQIFNNVRLVYYTEERRCRSL